MSLHSLSGKHTADLKASLHRHDHSLNGGQLCSPSSWKEKNG